MKYPDRPLIITLLLMLVIAPSYAWSGGEEKESIELLSEKLNGAIEARNFQEARQTIEELMPLMKEEIKKDKKYLSTLKKETEPETDPALVEKNLNRKMELYESLKKLVDVSPAALRVKSDLIKNEVKEFLDLS